MTDQSMPPVFTYDLPRVVRPPRRLGGSIVAALAVAVAVSALGFAVGWIWAEVAPRVAVIKADQGFYYAEAEPEQAIAADGWFAIIGAVAGLLIAVVAWYLLRRYRGPIMLVALIVGSVIGAVAALWLGTKIGMDQFNLVKNTAAEGARINAPLNLRITDFDRNHLWPPDPDFLWKSVPTGVAAVQALVAAAVYTVFAGFSGYQDLRGEPVPQPTYEYLSFDPQQLLLDHDGGQAPVGGTTYAPLPASAAPDPDHVRLDQRNPDHVVRDHSADQPAPDPVSPDQVSQDPVSPDQPRPDQPRPDQFGPGLTGSSDNATGTART